MSTSEFPIGQGNTLPIIRYRLLQTPEQPPRGRPGAKVAVDLTGCTVTFQMAGMEACCSSVTIKGSADIIDIKGGVVSYTWALNDTAIPGTYRATWTVTNAQGKTLDFPNDGYILVRIRPKVGN